jgi:hypothetical protein
MGEIGGDRVGGSTQERLLEIAASRARRAGEPLLVAETGPA